MSRRLTYLVIVFQIIDENPIFFSTQFQFTNGS